MAETDMGKTISSLLSSGMEALKGVFAWLMEQGQKLFAGGKENAASVASNPLAAGESMKAEISNLMKENGITVTDLLNPDGTPKAAASLTPAAKKVLDLSAALAKTDAGKVLINQMQQEFSPAGSGSLNAQIPVPAREGISRV